jgi:hypothetical protein
MEEWGTIVGGHSIRNPTEAPLRGGFVRGWGVPAARTATTNDQRGQGRGLRHVMVVAGTLADWRDCDDDNWRELITALGVAAGTEGASWLTVRPYAAGPGDHVAERREHTVEVDGSACTVVVEPTVDGREGFARAMAGLGPDEPVTEHTVSAVLYAPAEVEPDLVIVLGPADRLPPSLVWELAYAELVFSDAGWNALGAEHVHLAAAEFGSRHRRFGGIES